MCMYCSGFHRILPSNSQYNSPPVLFFYGRNAHLRHNIDVYALAKILGDEVPCRCNICAGVDQLPLFPRFFGINSSTQGFCLPLAKIPRKKVGWGYSQYKEFRLWHICEIGIPSNLKEKLLGEGRKKGLLVAAHTNFPLVFGIYTPEKNPEKDVIPNWYEFQMGNQQPTGWWSSCLSFAHFFESYRAGINSRILGREISCRRWRRYPPWNSHFRPWFSQWFPSMKKFPKLGQKRPSFRCELVVIVSGRVNTNNSS